MWGDDGTKYDDCGLMTPSSCDITWGNETLSGPGDPFDCGDDFMIPSVWFDQDPSQFMNGNADGLFIKPQGQSLSLVPFSSLFGNLIENLAILISDRHG